MSSLKIGEFISSIPVLFITQAISIANHSDLLSKLIFARYHLLATICHATYHLLQDPSTRPFSRL